MGFFGDIFGTSEVAGADRDEDGTLVGQGWVQSEVRDHDETGCAGTDYVSGRWGGLVCKKCGR